MPRKIFINLPVKHLKPSRAFYESIGAQLNPQFSDEATACMVLSDTISVMLLEHSKWTTFTKKPISDAHAAGEMMLALSCESRDAVNATAEAAGKAGGKVDVNPPQDYGFMLNRNVEDPDGHVWEFMWMDPNGMPAQG
jgi:uncharacterized protein